MKRVHGVDYASQPISVVRPAQLPSRKQVTALLAANIGMVDHGAHVIDVGVDVPGGIPVGVVAQSADGAMRIIDVVDGNDPSWIAHVLHHIRWVEQNWEAPAVRATAVVARLSQVAFNALSFLKDVHIDCMTVRCFTTGEERFLALERARAEGTREARRAQVAAKPGTRREPETLKPVELTDAEIADFLEA